MDLPVFSLMYLPPIAFFQEAQKHAEICIDIGEFYQKQSYRNRCIILSANGVESLIIPIQHTHSNQKLRMHEVLTEESQWLRRHWHSIRSAYGKSPYFMYYKDALESIYTSSFPISLVDFNKQLLLLLFRYFKLKTTIQWSENYIEFVPQEMDFRMLYSPKRTIDSSAFQLYTQNFSDRFGFQSNLSSLDLLMQCGPAALRYV